MSQFSRYESRATGEHVELDLGGRALGARLELPDGLSPYPAVHVTQALWGLIAHIERICGRLAAAVPLKEARDAGPIVVSSGVRAGFAGLLLGSVGHQRVDHAPCPVVVHGAAELDQRSRER